MEKVKEKEHIENLEEKKECKCHEGEKCTCGDDCNCKEDEKCTCGEECKCNDKQDKKKHHKKDKKAEEEIERLKKENIEALEKVKYAQAELVNYRKRKDEELINYKKYCNQDIITDLVLVADNFDRALASKDKVSDEVKKYLKGFEMISANLGEILKRYGVSEINNLGKPFNSNEEEAVMTDNNKDMDDDVVTEVLLKGYKLKDRVIRPASVKVNKLED